MSEEKLIKYILIFVAFVIGTPMLLLTIDDILTADSELQSCRTYIDVCAGESTSNPLCKKLKASIER